MSVLSAVELNQDVNNEDRLLYQSAKLMHSTSTETRGTLASLAQEVDEVANNHKLSLQFCATLRWVKFLSQFRWGYV